jgi:hypothetical protein
MWKVGMERQEEDMNRRGEVHGSGGLLLRIGEGDMKTIVEGFGEWVGAGVDE